MFLNWVTEDVVIKVIQNWQNFSANVLHHKPVYLHGGHLDRAGYAKFKDLILRCRIKSRSINSSTKEFYGLKQSIELI